MDTLSLCKNANFDSRKKINYINVITLLAFHNSYLKHDNDIYHYLNYNYERPMYVHLEYKL